MARKGKLLAALEHEKGRNIRLEQQRKQEKKAAKKRANGQADEQNANDEGEDVENSALAPNGGSVSGDSDEAQPPLADTMDVEDEFEDVEDDSEEEEEEEGGIPFSDIESLASEDRADVVPFQRLTINNTAALLQAHRSLAAPKGSPFSLSQSFVSSEPTEVKDVDDDLGRELAFYKQCLEAATEGRALLKREGIPFTRPGDFFAEMVKTDEHMDKIRAKMTEKAADRKAAADARKLRDLKKFGKQVQVAKLQERDRAKRETLDKINQLKRKRNASSGDTRDEDLFDVALEDAGKPVKKKPASGSKREFQPNAKRQHKNEKYGLGGKKRFKKSNDAVSSSDLGGFSTKKMKAASKGSKRLGKSRRAKLSG